MPRQTDIPFERDQSTRFLPWIVAVMVFLAALSAAFAIAVSDTIAAWDSTLTGRITIQVPGDDPDAALSRATNIVQRLDKLPEVANATLLPDAAVWALLEPWLGALPGTGKQALPMPKLIDVEMATGKSLDAAHLRAMLAEVGPDLVVDDHRVWLAALIDLARLVEAVALLVLVLIGASAITAVVFATRSGLAVHAPIVELLHLMGARDSYVARQFQAHAMWLGLRGGIIGGAAAIAVLAAIAWVARDIDAAFLPELRPTPADVVLLFAVPVFAVLITMATARMTVLRALARLP